MPEHDFPGGWWLGASPLISKRIRNGSMKYRRYDLFAPDDMIHSLPEPPAIGQQSADGQPGRSHWQFPNGPNLPNPIACFRPSWLGSGEAYRTLTAAWLGHCRPDRRRRGARHQSDRLRRTWMLCSPWLVPWCPGSMDASVRSPAISGRAPTIGLRCGRCKTGGACAIRNRLALSGARCWGLLILAADLPGCNRGALQRHCSRIWIASASRCAMVSSRATFSNATSRSRLSGTAQASSCQSLRRICAIFRELSQLLRLSPRRRGVHAGGLWRSCRSAQPPATRGLF